MFSFAYKEITVFILSSLSLTISVPISSPFLIGALRGPLYLMKL